MVSWQCRYSSQLKACNYQCGSNYQRMAVLSHCDKFLT